MRRTVWLGGLIGCFALGLGFGLGAKDMKYPGIDAVRGKPPRDAALAALAEAEVLAKQGTWERLAIARVYYLKLDKARGQSIIDSVLSGKVKGTDFQRAGQIYAEAGENSRAEELFTRALAIDPKDDTGQAEIGAWYIRTGRRDRGEDLLAVAFSKNPDELWHYVRAAEALSDLAPR